MTSSLSWYLKFGSPLCYFTERSMAIDIRKKIFLWSGKLEWVCVVGTFDENYNSYNSHLGILVPLRDFGQFSNKCASEVIYLFPMMLFHDVWILTATSFQVRLFRRVWLQLEWTNDIDWCTTVSSVHRHDRRRTDERTNIIDCWGRRAKHA
jgi:hypothetical protein